MFSLFWLLNLNTWVKSSVAEAPTATAGSAANPFASVFIALVLVIPTPSRPLSPPKKSVASVTEPSVVERRYRPTAISDAVWAVVTPIAPFAAIVSPVVPLLNSNAFNSLLYPTLIPKRLSFSWISSPSATKLTQDKIYPPLIKLIVESTLETRPKLLVSVAVLLP